MRLFVVTTGTKDYGDIFVVREHRDGVASLQPLSVTSTLEEARGAIEEYAPSLVRLPRCKMDDPVIVESWGSAEDVATCLLTQDALETGAAR